MPGIDDYRKWIGRTEVASQVAELWPITGLYALLDRDETPKIGEPLPPCGHWLYFTPMVRMWAASDITFHAPIRLGNEMEKKARIADIARKEGTSGALIFVTVDNDYRVAGALALSETQTIVYRDHPKLDEAPPPPKPAPENPAWSRQVKSDPVMLFRYSAVTFNGHRIHYDHPYVTQEEGYPGVIVQGQLIATLLLEAFAAHNPETTEPKRFSFRAMKPLFAGEPFFAEGARNDAGGFDLWSRNADGHLTLSAKLEV
jgi:3-methylfumaryl-CoA hydratase